MNAITQAATQVGHTPGPWRIDFDDRPDMEWNSHVVSDRGETICFMAHGGPDRQDEFDANARLIAAAPEMAAELALLREERAEMHALIRDLLAVWDPEWEPGESLHQRAVDWLARAEGRQP